MSGNPATRVATLLAFALCCAPAIQWPACGAAAEEVVNQTPANGNTASSQRLELLREDWIAQQTADFLLPGAEQAAKPVVTTSEDAAGGNDGIRTGLWGFHVASGEKDPWWQVDLGQLVQLDRIVVYNRSGSSAARTAKLQILVSASSDQPFHLVYQHAGKPFGGVEGAPLTVSLKADQVSARIVRLGIPGKCSFALDEVEVYGAEDPSRNLALGKPADQISVSQYSADGTMSDEQFRQLGFAPLAPRPTSTEQTVQEISASAIKDQIRRARELATRLQGKANSRQLAQATEQLEALESRLKDGQESSLEIYMQVRQVKRRIAFANPLLGVERLLFIKRHDAGGVFHMCDQYYGCNAKPGGGLYVLEHPFSEQPRLKNLLENSVVENGRLAGRKLQGGSFLSPEVSYDGETILFAYSEAKAKETYQWAPEFSYHIFKVNADGTGLVQLTDGPWDDFDPCFLPNGRIVFVSERRGGYLRCGRHCPVYTMFSMRPDGGDVICLSFHETHEWHPSVTNDGMLVYTRWDYVDRDTNVAHHIWTCYPDGRDPRSFHGNYPLKRESRPWMEMSIRAIPGSHKFVAVTGAHHGHAFGSLVLIDPRLEDDGAMAQLERLTPEVPFPEAEARPIDRYMIYGTPWPLDEDNYLCVYGADAKNRGVYWIDRFGNKELLYRDPTISCLSPIPLRSRPMPPVIPAKTSQAAEDADKHRPATVAVMNVYDADFPWPDDTRIEALRVIQVLPKSTAPPNQPRIGTADQTNARAVLGTVPVEADGSVFFEAPVGKPIYFQALDEHGRAVQSMRSATYVHPGEELRCQGCHERKHDPPGKTARVPLAMRRDPSPIEPDVDGSAPFSYVRLVQPVLDSKCVDCHRKEKAIDLSGELDAANGWSRSYASLAPKYGFYYDVSNGSIKDAEHGGSRTPVGEFGARVARLSKYLAKEHYGVQLTPEERHRLDLWLDCNSEFYGSYENIAAQARGEIVSPTLE